MCDRHQSNNDGNSHKPVGRSRAPRRAADNGSIRQAGRPAHSVHGRARRSAGSRATAVTLSGPLSSRPEPKIVRPAKERATRWQAVVAAVDSLDSTAQDVFVAYHVFGDSLFEIAEQTRSTPLSIEQTLTRASRNLRTSLCNIPSRGGD